MVPSVAIARPIGRTEYERLFDASTQRVQMWLATSPQPDPWTASIVIRLREALTEIASRSMAEGRRYPIRLSLAEGEEIELPAARLFAYLRGIEEQLSGAPGRFILRQISWSRRREPPEVPGGFVYLTPGDAPFVVKKDSTWTWIYERFFPATHIFNDPQWMELTDLGKVISRIEKAQQRQEVREISDPDYQRGEMKPYYGDGIWNLAKLKKQIEADLIRSKIKLNGEHLFQFNRLCELLKLTKVSIFDSPIYPESLLTEQENKAIRFMCMLQQGAPAALQTDVHQFFELSVLKLSVLPKQPQGAQAAIIDVVGLWRKGGAIVERIGEYKERWPDTFLPYLKSAVAQGCLPSSFCPEADTPDAALLIYPWDIDGVFDPERVQVDVNQHLKVVESSRTPTRLERSILGLTVWREGEGATHSWRFV